MYIHQSHDDNLPWRTWIMPEIVTAYRNAVQNPKNKKNGSLNWNLVVTECYMELAYFLEFEDRDRCPLDVAKQIEEFYEQLDYLVNCEKNSS